MSELTDLLFPPSCLACATVLPERAFFCARCQDELERTPERRCEVCAEPGIHEAGVCARCRARAPSFERAFAPFAHQGPIARAIHRFKYEDQPELAPSLVSLLASESRPFLEQAPLLLCAIPLHSKRFRERRYDQAMLLAAELARGTGRELLDALARVKETRRQVGLSDEGREANLAGAFRATEEVEGRRLLLVDDVLTTGATARAAAKALLSAGAAGVQVLTLARANLLG